EFNKEINVLSGKEEILHNINIGNMILSAFKSRPDFVGQINAVTEEQITYQQMRENSVKCALWLKQSCYKNIVITICTRNKMLEYIPFLASLYVGATVNTIRITYFLIEYEPNIIFIDSDNYSQLKSAIQYLDYKRNNMNRPKIITFDKIEGVDSLESILNNDFEKVSWVFFESKMYNQMFYTDIHMYDISSLKQLVIDDSAINFSDNQEKLNEKFINVSIVQVYSMYNLNQLLMIGMHYLKLIIIAFLRYSRIMHNFNKWYCTGDYGYYEKDGEIFLIDKVKDLIKYRTFHLSSAKIENTLLQHSAVSEVAVLSVPHSANGQHPVAYVKKECGAEVTKEELIEFVAQNLPEIYQLRGGLYFKKHIPHLPSGKVDRMLVTGI
ncbi:LUCI monooxygenase, partial [Pseudoatta argentina]